MRAVRSLGIAVASLVVLAAPVAIGLWSTPDWRVSPRFDGQVYVVSEAGVVPQALDPSGAAAVVASLAGGLDGGMDEAEALTRLEASGFDGQLSTFAAALAAEGLPGRWLSAEPRALAALRTPFIAHLRDAGGRLVLVRRVAAGHVYVADPLRGNVLYPEHAFASDWTGQVFVFDQAPQGVAP